VLVHVPGGDRIGDPLEAQGLDKPVEQGRSVMVPDGADDAMRAQVLANIGKILGRVRLSSDYSEIKIRLKFAPDAGPSAPGERYTIACARDRYPQGRDQHRDHAFRINSFPGKSFGSSA
jgi:hypothetical protein